MIVLDASAAIELLLLSSTGLRVSDRVFRGGETVHAPELLDLEVLQVLRRRERDGDLTSRRALEALEDLADMGIERYPHGLLMARVWELRANLTAYDAVYVALAEVLEVPLVTCDARLQRAPHDAKVEVLA